MSAPDRILDADRPVRWRRWGMLALLGVLGFGLQVSCALDSALTERVYGQTVYPHVQRVLATGSGWSPIAVGETLLLAGVVWITWRIVRGVVARRRGRRTFRNLGAHALAQAAGAFGVLFLAFQLLWGLNHARLPFATHVGLQPGPAVPSELARVARRLAERAAAVRPPELEPVAGFLAPDWCDAVAAAYDAAGRAWPVLAGPRPPIRAPWISKLMTLCSVTGIYSPFTGEPNVNSDMPEVLRPFVACHEVAHLRGFAREDEANFIAWWVGCRSNDPVLAYSCELQAYRIAMAELQRTSYSAWREVREQAPQIVQRDSAAIREFWLGQPQTVHRVLSTIVEATNDAYLKSSGSEEGVRSYGRMVDLLIAALRG